MKIEPKSLRFQFLFKNRWFVASLLVVGVFAVASPSIADNVSSMAQRLTKLRGEVEQLAAKLSAKNVETSDQLRSLARQKADIELELKREQTRVQKISAAVAKRKAEIQELKSKGDQLVPLFEESADKVRSYIKRSLPFRTSARLAAVDKIQEQYKAGLLTPSRALSRLWSFVEDEFRMTRENGLFQQTLTVGETEILADVVRVGMVMLYFKSTDDTTVGKAVKDNGQWKFVTLDGPEDRKLVLDLFKSFKKQIRVGYFEIPNGLSLDGANGANGEAK